MANDTPIESIYDLTIDHACPSTWIDVASAFVPKATARDFAFIKPEAFPYSTPEFLTATAFLSSISVACDKVPLRDDTAFM